MGWLLSIGICCACVYGPYSDGNKHVLSVEESAAFYGLMRTGWGVAVSWIIFSCATGYGGRVKLGIFGQTAKFGQRHCLFHISNIGLKIKSTKHTVKFLMRRLIRSRLIKIYTVCKRVSEFT